MRLALVPSHGRRDAVGAAAEHRVLREMLEAGMQAVKVLPGQRQAVLHRRSVPNFGGRPFTPAQPSSYSTRRRRSSAARAAASACLKAAASGSGGMSSPIGGSERHVQS